MDALNGGLQAAPHHPAKAKACIFLTMLGGVSQMDTFDPKPVLEKFDNTVMDWSKEKLTDQVNLFAKPRLILRSPWKFSKHGQCGMDVSELLPNLATCVDDIAFVKSVRDREWQSSGCDVPDEHRTRAAWTSFSRRMGDIRAWIGEQESSRLRRSARLPRPPVQRLAAMGTGVSAGQLSGHDDAVEGRSGQ